MMKRPRLEDMTDQELDALHAELYLANLSFHSMKISNIKHKFLREHLQDAMDPVKELMQNIDKTMDTRRGMA